MRSLRPKARSSAAAAVVLVAGVLGGGNASAVTHARASASARTTTPIKHVIVIVGENHTFDNVFATYKPRHDQTIKNLLSEGIVRANGNPGPHVSLARQWTAKDVTADGYSTDPKLVAPYKTLPAPNTTYVDPRCDGGQAMNANDSRFPATLPNAPFQITKFVPYDEVHAGFQVCDNGAYVGDPLHRFYQMNQQTEQNQNKLWVWTADTAGDSNGAAPTGTTDQGALSMGFYNVQHGDAPVLDYLANHFSMSDNYHQAVMGGTGTNHVALGTGSAASYENAAGDPLTPPANQIENPNPQPGTNNFYTQDGYSGGTYSKCSDPSQPGVGVVIGYLQQMWPDAHTGCAPDTYYMLNNYNPGYLADGTPDPGPFAVPPQSQTTFPTIGDELNAHSISWGYYGQGWNNGNPNLAQYCNICNPFQYATSIMTSSTQRRQHLHGLSQFQQAAKSGNLPAVSIVKPEGTFDGHAGYSTLAAFEAFASTVIGDVAQDPSLWKSTAIFVTEDEGGGYYDSGYIQPTSFFGDGTRVPMIAVSPWVSPGHIDHTYADHVSVLKFIEANWHLRPLSGTSFDNLPNPVARHSNPYVPINGPAIGNLMSLFDFHRSAHAINAERVALMRLSAHHTLRPFANAKVTAPDANGLD
jgi:acid phosphatase